MLRSNRKHSPVSVTGINSSTLPSYYNSQDPMNKATTGHSHAAPPRRRRRTNGNPIPHRCCSKWTLLFVLFSFLGSILMVHRSETAVHHLSKVHKAIKKTLQADPPHDTNNHLPQRRVQAATPPAQLLPPKPPSHGVYDVAVLGAGPAGLTAALFAARAGLSVLVLGSEAGSLSETHRLENFPSWVLEASGGPQWLETTKVQAAQWGATFAQAGLLVDQLSAPQQDNGAPFFSLELSNGSLQTHARAVIVATGATGRRLGLPLEHELWGKSVHSCAVCDGSSYVHKVVVVVGGGDAAVDGALLLARYAKQVILVHRRDQLRASNSRNMELLQTTPNIRLNTPYTVTKFETTQTKKRNPVTNVEEDQYVLTAVELKHTLAASTQRIECDGVFELIGSTPNTEWLKSSGAQLDQGGFLTLSNPTGQTRTATSIEGIFAAGEVTDQIYRQAITAAAEGAEAAMDAERWLRNHPAPKHTATQRHAKIPLQTVLVQDATQSDEAQVQDQEPEPPNSPEEEDDCDLTQEECILKTVNKYPVVVFSKPWCPYCRKALEALAAEGLPEGHSNLHVVDLSLLGPKTRLVQGTLQSLTGRRTVPNVYVGGSSIGGGDETSQYHRAGQLHDMLVRAKAIEERISEQEQNSPCDDLTKEACITQLVNQYPVVMFVKPGCPHCRRALEALALEGLPKQNRNLHVVNLASLANMGQIQDQLQSMTGRRTVPNVFLGGRSIGGGSETVQFQKSGELRNMLAKVHAI